MGSNTTLTCVVISAFSPSVQWLDKNNNLVTFSGDFIWMEEPYTIGRATYVHLNFDPIRSSHGGWYTCKSVISNPASTNSTSKMVSIKCKYAIYKNVYNIHAIRFGGNGT